jgi:hypothetical protein
VTPAIVSSRTLHHFAAQAHGSRSRVTLMQIRLAGAMLALALSASLDGAAQRATTATAPEDATSRIVASAQAVLAVLDDAQRGKVQFRFDDTAQKTRWSNLPSPMYQREGLRLGDLTAAQRTAVMKLLQTALSADGYRKVTEIMQGDEVLKTTGGGRAPRGGGPAAGGPPGPGAPNGGPPNGPPSGGPPNGGPPTGGPPQGGGRGRGGPGGGLMFGQDQYWLAFLGTPSTTSPWMLQFGGHHLAINLTLGGAQASMTPSLPAAQPAKFTIEGREIRPLGKENDKAFALINALDEDGRKQAILNYRVADLVLGPGQDGRTIQPEGLRASAMTPAQQTMLLDIVREWAGIMNGAYAEPRMAEIRTNLPQTYFAWSGPTENGAPAYFRIQGPTLVIEYAPQGGSVDHIHTIYRDPTNDYGAKFSK